MKKMLLCSCSVITLLMAGCSPEEPKEEKKVSAVQISNKAAFTNWEPSPEFKGPDGETLIGEEGRLGLLGPNFESGQSNKWLWHLAGAKEEITGKSLKVVAVNKESGKKEKVLIQDGGTRSEEKVWVYNELGFAPLGKYTTMPCNMELSTPGVWRLEVYLDDKPFGSIVVNVKEKS